MRILAIRGKNLASLAEPFEVVLNAGALEHAGLFAITGQTGAGKSTILDALCLALYDQIPRLPSGQGFAIGHHDEDTKHRVISNDVRSILRRGTSHAYAEVDFIAKDKQSYRARWEVSKARGKVEGRLQPQEVTLSQLASGQLIGQGKKSTLEAISGLIDLNFDQFRRSVLLAQGDFAAFLKAKKDERSNLLERITGTELYSKLSIAAFDRAKLEKDALKHISSRMEDKIPLDETARRALVQQREQLTQQLSELDKAIADQQKIIAWYAELTQRQAAERQARAVLNNRQNEWERATAARQLMQKVEAVQPLRPLLTHVQTAHAEHQDAQQQQHTNADLQHAVSQTVRTATLQRDSTAALLSHAEQQQQQAQPLLIAARALDTRIDIVQHAVGTLTREMLPLTDALKNAEQDHQILVSRHAEHTASLQRLKQWLAENHALEAIAAEWSRWEAELERYQTLYRRKTETEDEINPLQHAIAQDEPQHAALKHAIECNDQQLAQHHTHLAQIKAEDPQQQSIEDLHRAKDTLNNQRGQLSHALNLANTAHALQQASQQEREQLNAIEQTLIDGAAQCQQLSQQQTFTRIRLTEAKKALELMQATTHKTAQDFRALLQEEQPCPVCGAVEHPWQDAATIRNEHATAQISRVGELENQHETLVKTLAECTQTLAYAQRQKIDLTARLLSAQTKLNQATAEWTAFSGLEKPDLALTDGSLLPELKRHAEQIDLALVALKQQEQAALTLQKQVSSAQDLLADSQQNKERLIEQLSALEQRQVKNRTDLGQLCTVSEELSRQLAQLTDVLAIPFQPVDNWQPLLQTAASTFKQDWAAKAQQFQRNQQHIEAATLALVAVSHAEKLAAQAFEQCQQHCQLKQAVLISQTALLQTLVSERATVLPNADTTADSYEQSLQHTLQAAKTAQQHASERVKQADTTLANHTQQHQHWQTETIRRAETLKKSENTLNEALAKQALTVAQLRELLAKDDVWLATQKTTMAALERSLQEAEVLVAMKTDACLTHNSQPVDKTEAEASQVLQVAQQQRQSVYSLREEQIILLREDDKKIAAGQALKAEWDSQQHCWEHWESLNELIGSASGGKFRTFAQSLTLEALLAHSNHHLQDFAKRYALQRVPGSDLELQIIDRDMADDVRSVHSLSGGESFLVSLALALGLASLSSNTTQVESLFIDEGFGSLDPETLDIAITSLDTLQALGRKVGVISHVPILVERIGAKVVVEKLGGGRSRVVLVGG